MKSLLKPALVSGMVMLGSQAMAINSPPQSVLNRRQLNGCMTRQMAASRTLSYNDAAKLCKQQLKAQSESLASNDEAKPANAR